MNIEEKYEKLLYWFKEISKVPRNSCNEEKIADYICDFAKERNLEYKKDELFNVLVKKKASVGFENKDAIILQAHTDMVCQKTNNSTHNFENDPIEIVEREEILTANDTTLGADDGIGVATLLLMLDDEEIEHPEIYCLFTTQEETKQILDLIINLKQKVIEYSKDARGLVETSGNVGVVENTNSMCNTRRGGMWNDK